MLWHELSCCSRVHGVRPTVAAEQSGVPPGFVQLTVNSLQLASSVATREKGTDLEEVAGHRQGLTYNLEKVSCVYVWEDADARQDTKGSRAQGTHWGRVCESSPVAKVVLRMRARVY